MLRLQEMAIGSAEMAPNSYDCEDLVDLWCACAGPGVTISQAGELVVYFPQGHLEQAGKVVPKHLRGVCSASSQSTCPSGSNPGPRRPNSNVWEQRPCQAGLHGCEANSRLEGVSPQIICRVLNVELKPSETDRVYAWMLLEPLLDSELIDNKHLPPPMARHPAPYFCKKLGAKDTVAHAWLSIPRKDAERCLPQLDMTQMAPMQVLVAKDLSGKEWRFQHRLVGKMRHRLQTAEFATSNNLVAGDGIVILRGQDGDLHVGARRAMRQMRNVSAPEMPDEGCETGLSILQSISHAVTTRSKFTVLYKPTTGTDQFVVSCNRYYESIKSYYTGMRFRMISSREAAMEDRVSGTISGIVDFDEAWPRSNWKCLQVKWDKKSPVAILNNVCPWEIEPVKRSSGCILPATETKRTRSKKGSQREYQRQSAEACLNKAKRVLQLHHDESAKQEPSCIVENKIYLSAVDDLIDLSTDSSFSGLSAAADDVRKQAQAALDIEMSNLAKTLYGLKLWNTNHFEDLDSSPHFQGTVIKLDSLLALDGPCLSSTSSEPTSLSSNSTGISSRDSDLMPAEDCTTLHNVISCLEEKKVDLINTKSVKVIASIV